MVFFPRLEILFKTDATAIDNHVFRLHYRTTAVILLGFGVIVSSRQYVGDPIDCFSKDNTPTNVLDTLCWIHPTYSLPDAWEKEVGEEVPYPGVGRYTPGEKRVYHAYYQWVWLVLPLQAFFFYVPRYFWRAMEGGRIKNLILGLNSPILPEDTKSANLRLLVEYMVVNMNNHGVYLASYAFAEAMNLANVVGQIFLVDAFLGGEFSTHGSKVIQFTGRDWSVRSDPMIKVFPRLTKCTFHEYGSSGDVQRHDATCILPINVVNEKIYVFLWFWFLLLAVLSGLALLYRAAVVLSPRTRLAVTRSRARLAHRVRLETVVRRCRPGDWLLLHLLSKNLDPLHFRDVVDDLAGRLDVHEAILLDNVSIYPAQLI